jgi:hypothetical protein
MQRSVEKLFKEYGTPVYVRFDNALKLVLLNIKDWQHELKDIWAEHIKLDNSGVYEVPVEHGVTCKCCAKIIRVESYTHPFDFEVKQVPRNLVDLE